MHTGSSWRALERHMLVRQDLAVSTVEKSIRNLRAMSLEGFDALAPTPEAYDAFIEKRKLAGARGTALQHYYKATQRVLRWKRLHWHDFECPRAEEPDIELAPDPVIMRFLNYHVGADDQDDDDVALLRFIFRFGHFTAIRPELEYTRIREKDYNRDTRELWVWADKVDRGRTLQLEPWIADLVEEYLDELRPRLDARVSSQLLLDVHGKPLRVDRFRAWLSRAGKEIYPWWRPYDARHWGLTWRLIEWDLRILPVKRWAGHRKIATTEKYLHVAEEKYRARMIAHEIPPMPGLASA